MFTGGPEEKPTVNLVWGSQIGTYEWRPDVDRVMWSPELMKIYGVTEAPASEREFGLLVHPDDRTRVEAETSGFLSSNALAYSHTFRILRPDGTVRVILDRGALDRDAAGLVIRIRGVNIDVTDEAHLNYAAEERLRASEARYRRLFDAIDEGFCVVEVELDAPGGRIDYRVVDANPAFYDKTGFPKSILNAWLREAAPGLEEHWFQTYGRVARTGEPIRFENHSAHLGRWFEVYAFPADDRSVGILFSDISIRKDQEEQTRLLVQEVNHRTKNILGIVRAIARLSASSDGDAFLERFGARVQALSASHDLLFHNAWSSVSLQDLLRSQLAPFADFDTHRITLEGPALLLSEASTKALGMAFHELATNAAKYGALSNMTGQIEVRWAVTQAPDATLTIDWVERGGPPVQPPTRQGFGTTVTTRMAEDSTGGKVTTSFDPEGVTWRFSGMLDSLLR